MSADEPLLRDLLAFLVGGAKDDMVQTEGLGKTNDVVQKDVKALGWKVNLRHFLQGVDCLNSAGTGLFRYSTRVRKLMRFPPKIKMEDDSPVIYGLELNVSYWLSLSFLSRFPSTILKFKPYNLLSFLHTTYLDCLQSAFSLKIRLVLISSSAIENHDVINKELRPD